MNKFEIKRLLSGEETIQSLREKPWEWQSLKSYEATNDSETMEILLKRVQKNVYTQVCPKCFAHTDFHSRFCPHCGTFIRDNKLLSQKVIDSCVTKLEVKKTNAVPSQENISSKATDTGSAQDTGELSENILLNDYSHGSTLAGIWVYKTYYYALPRIIEYSTYHIADYPDPESDRCLRVSVPDNIKTKKDLEEFARTQRPSWY